MQAWVERAVIGLRLCPFAKAVHAKGQVRYVVSRARTPKGLLTVLIHELQLLARTDPQQIDDTLLVAPRALADFLEFNAFVQVAGSVVKALGLRGVLQVASFHPQYRFAGAAPNALSNFTNRAPYPTLHLLREASIGRAVATFPDTGAIPDRNIATLRRLGRAGWAALKVDPPPAE